MYQSKDKNLNLKSKQQLIDPIKPEKIIKKFILLLASHFAQITTHYKNKTTERNKREKI